MINLVSWLVAAIWIYLLCARGGFWRAQERHDRDVPPAPARWPAVTAIIPARDEAETIGKAVSSLLLQDYPGHLDVIVVDDGSTDGTSEAAYAAAAALGAGDGLTVIEGAPPPRGWTGKLWALQQGFERAARAGHADYLLLTDADIVHGPRALIDLVCRAEAGGHVLASVMARLNCRSFAERCAIPAFVYFFQMLYPFAWVGRHDCKTAAAAGGCMLVAAKALKAIGGFGSISDALIDDCALARRLSEQGPIWLGLSESVHSIRRYDGFGPIGRMIRRSAYAELKFSPFRLFAAMLGMILTFIAPPLLALLASGHAALLGAFGWILMMISFQPMLRFYGVSPLWALAMPAIAALYMAWTVQSAIEHMQGRGGSWKGRFQARAGGAR